MSELPPSDWLGIMGRTIELLLVFVVCVALKALSSDEFFAGWFGGILFACVYWRVWETIK